NTKLQTPNTKLQTPEKLQAPSSKLEARAAVWSLELGISLVFGSWFLVFRFRNFSGAWGLVLGVSLSGTAPIGGAQRCSGNGCVGPPVVVREWSTFIVVSLQMKNVFQPRQRHA